MISCKCVEHANERRGVYRLRAREYGRLYRNIPADEWKDEFDEAVLPDGRPQSLTLLAEQEGKVIGTGRLTLTRHPAYPPLTTDCQRLMDFDLDQLLWVAGFDPQRVVVGEVSRVAIARDANTLLAKQSVLSRLGHEARMLGMDIVLAIMPAWVYQRLAEGFGMGGLHFRRWERAHCRRETLEDIRVLLRYHDYFLPALRERGLEIDPEALERANNLVSRQTSIDG
jgi:hypothetical protein